MVSVGLIIFAVIVGATFDCVNAQCRLDPHPSVEYLCLVPGATEGSRVCSANEPAGTSVNPRCRRPNYYSATPLPFMRCIDGYWDYIARCTPECGRVTPDGAGLVVGGQAAMRGELPWHAGIYSTTTDPYMQVCGGSLISNNVVLSAAHCFWSDLEKQLPASMFAVAVGKLYRPWKNTKDEAQKSQVKVIHLPTRFQGTSTNFQDDIAVVIVAKEFQFKTHIRPVCLSFDYHFEQQQLFSGNKGKVAGWGLTSADGKSSPVLQVVDLPYVEVGTCINKSPPDYREYITSDKICAGNLEPNTALCKGDSGGGLAFSESITGVERYYLRGVVSTAATSKAACNTATYTSFTSIARHEKFIKQFWIESGEFKCQDGSVITAANECDGVKDCADGSDETVHACAKKPCSDSLFRCGYGACVDRGATCNGVVDCADSSDEADILCGTSFNEPRGKCVLPPYPEHGTYDSNIAGAVPGQGFERAILSNITCQRGYAIIGATSQQIYCFDGIWTDDIPKCVQICEGYIDSNSVVVSGYEFVNQTGHCYKFHTQTANWTAANRTCGTEGARLAVPNSAEEARVLLELFAKYPKDVIPGFAYRDAVAIGIYREADRWTTVDGENFTKAEYAEWKSGRPSAELPIRIGSRCCGVLFGRDGKITDAQLGYDVPFICEKAP